MSGSREPPHLPEPDRTADERATLVEMLDRQRSLLLRKVAGLTRAQLGYEAAPSDLSLAKLLMHMAVVEDYLLDEMFLGNPACEPWAGADWDADTDAEMSMAATMSADELFAQFDESVSRSRATIAAAHSLDQQAAREHPRGGGWTLRWILLHMIAEYARHCGHADYIRQSIDGSTGE